MAVTYDADTTFSASTNPTGTHTPVAAGALGAIVAFIEQDDNDPTDDVTGIDYGGAAMTRVPTHGFVAADAGGEQGALYAYTLLSGIPTGAQTVTCQGSGTTNKVMRVISYTAAAAVSIDTANSSDSASQANPSIVLATTAATNTAIAAVLLSGHNAGGSLAAGADYTQVDLEEDWGLQLSSCIRRTSNASGGNVTVDWVATAKEAAIIAIALKEASTPPPPPTGVGFGVGGMGFDSVVEVVGY